MSDAAAPHDPPSLARTDCKSVPLVSQVSQLRPEDRDDLSELLDQLDELLRRYVVFPSIEARHATAAWIIHCHVIEAFDSTPRLAALSAEKGSGKTRLLEVVGLVVPNPLHTVTISAAALFRKVADGPCTLLLDEADTYLGLRVRDNHEDLRGLVNAGHRRGAVAYRCEVSGRATTVREYPAFAPVALAGIGDLPDTILDRSIVINMKRRASNELVTPFRIRRAQEETRGLRDDLADWSIRNAFRLAAIEPEMPSGITDRPADVWEALIIVGDCAGADWSGRLRGAATKLNAEREGRDSSLGVHLLGDCRVAFDSQDRLTTEQLLEKLLALEESPWSDIRGQALDARGLAKLLRPYGVRPGSHRFGESTRKGYLRADFHDPWSRYLSAPAPGEGQQGEHPKRPADVFDDDGYEAEIEEP